MANPPVTYSQFGSLIQGQLDRKRGVPEPDPSALDSSRPNPPELIFPDLEKPTGPSAQDRRSAKFQHVAEGLMAFSQLFAGKDVELPGKAMAALRAQEEASETEARQLENMKRMQQARLNNETRMEEFKAKRDEYLQDRAEQKSLEFALKKAEALLKFEVEHGLVDRPETQKLNRMVTEIPALYTGKIPSDDALRGRLEQRFGEQWDTFDAGFKAHAIRKLKNGYESIQNSERQNLEAKQSGGIGELSDLLDSWGAEHTRGTAWVKERRLTLENEIKSIEDEPGRRKRITETATKIGKAKDRIEGDLNAVMTELRVLANAGEGDGTAANKRLTDLVAAVNAAPPEQRVSTLSQLLDEASDLQIETGVFDTYLPNATINTKDGEQSLRFLAQRMKGDQDELTRLEPELAGMQAEIKDAVAPIRDEIAAMRANPRQYFPSGTTEALEQKTSLIGAYNKELGDRLHAAINGGGTAPPPPPSGKPGPLPTTSSGASPVAGMRAGTIEGADPQSKALVRLVKTPSTLEGGEAVFTNVGWLLNNINKLQDLDLVREGSADIYEEFFIDVEKQGVSYPVLRNWTVEALNASYGPGVGEEVVKSWEIQLNLVEAPDAE